MEYMACGGPVIATFASGHQDVLTDENSLPLRRLRAYQNRGRLAEIGRRAAQDMTRFTWADTARRFLELLQPR